MVLVFGLRLPLLDLKRALYATMRQNKLKATFFKTAYSSQCYNSHSNSLLQNQSNQEQLIELMQGTQQTMQKNIREENVNVCRQQWKCMVQCLNKTMSLFSLFSWLWSTQSPGYAGLILGKYRHYTKNLLDYVCWAKKVDAKFSYHSSAFPFFRHKSTLSSHEP